MSPYTVFVIDDDNGVRKALARLLLGGGFNVQTFSSPETFLEKHDPAVPGCVVLDLVMPGMTGLELQEALRLSGSGRFVIFLTGRGDVPSSVRAMKAGAVDFLTKPVARGDLMRAVNVAIESDRRSRLANDELFAIEQRLATLTRREREVLQFVAAGHLNKQTAADLGVCEKTIKVHRARVMEKMGVRSLAELVRVVQRLGISSIDEVHR